MNFPGAPFLPRNAFRLALLLTLAAPVAPLVAAATTPPRWHWSNPLPHGANIVDEAFDPTRPLAVQVAERGQVFTSPDFAYWTARDSGTTRALRAVTFFGDRLLVTGEAGTLLYADEPDGFLPGTLNGASTDLWLEAVTASPTLALAAGDEGLVCTSQDGVFWVRQNSGSTAWFRGAAFGGSNFVVVGDAGAILTSPNGTNWTKRSSPTSQDLNRVVFANTRFTAVGDAGAMISSTNGGLNWFNERPGATNVLQHAAASGLARLVAGTQEVRLHIGLAWSDQLALSNGPPRWTYYTALGRPGYFHIAGRTGMQAEAYATNSLGPWSWYVRDPGIRNWLWDILHLPGLYVAAGDFGTIMTSSDGVGWNLELVPASAANATLLGLGGNTNLLLAAGSGGMLLYSPALLTNIVVPGPSGSVTQTVSSLGILWRAMPQPVTTNDLQAVAVLSNSVFVVAGARGSLFTSTNGTNWTSRNSKSTNFISGMCDWPGGLMASGKNGMILRSPDAISWEAVPTGLTNWLYRVRWLNGRLVAVGQGGVVLVSTNGTDWSAKNSGTTAWLSDAVFIQDTWWAVGHGGTVLSSADLETWTDMGTLTLKSLYGAATDSKQLVTVGVEGLILRSQVVPELAPVTILNYDRISTNGAAPAYNVFLFGGKVDQRFSLDSGTNLVGSAWTPGPELEFTDSSGTLYYVETLTDTNLPPIEFYQTRLLP